MSAAPTWFVYILLCRDATLYTGVAVDLDRRFRQHLAGTASRYTRSRLPAKLVYREEQPDRSAAQKREAAIKRLTRREKLALIRSPKYSAPAGESPDNPPAEPMAS